MYDRQKIARAIGVLLLSSAAELALLGTTRAADEDVQMPTASDYGGIGLIEMRNARFMPDGDLAIMTTVKSPDDRVALTFQALPWLEATFRYSINYALPPMGQRALYDRSFDVKARLWEEGDVLPQFAIGIQDILGTGVYSGEYMVASKQFGPVDATVGMGWGRLASRSAFENPLSLISGWFDNRPGFSGSGGTPLYKEWFHGKDVGMFGGIEYQTPIPKLTLKVEYSSDAYSRESDRQHLNYAPLPLNFEASYRFWSNVDVGIAYIGGKELAATFNLSFDPEEPEYPKRVDAPAPFVARTDDVVTQVERAHQIAAGQKDDESWRVHFVDLTQKPAPRTADVNASRPSLTLAVIPATFSVTDQWMQGKTLVVQIHPSANAPRGGDLCAQLVPSLRQERGAQDIAMVDGNWNPLKFCKPSRIGVMQVADVQQLPMAAPVADAVSSGMSSFFRVTAQDVERMRQAILAQRIGVEGISANDTAVTVEVSNGHYLRDAEVIARTARALSASAPPGIMVFRITTVDAYMPATTVTIPRSEIDAIGDHSGSPAELWNSMILEPARADTPYPNGDGFPRFDWSIFPNFLPSAFDPDNPIYIGVGVSGSASVTLLRGLTLGGQATYSIYNNFNDITRTSNSVLPHVRSDIVEYLKQGASGIDDLTLAYTTKISSEFYGRVAAGYIESMYAGVGGEVLYRPFDQRWAIGLDLWDVRKRNFDRLFGLQKYQTVTGNLTFYFQTPYHGYSGYVSVGRYLAKDYGATLELDRTFDTGVKIGAWMTLTNVPFSKFGEGSFDKGIRIVIPIEWVLPFGSTTTYQLALRPIQRDGGQPLDNARVLYDLTNSSSYGQLDRQWADTFH